jgi:DNA replication protein DnaC
MSSDDTTTTQTTKATDLTTTLKALGLWRIAEDLDDFVARATKARWSVVQVLTELGRLETQERARRSCERRLSRSKVGRFKPMADFDWNWPTKIERPAVERVLSLGFVERAENVVMVAPQGLGKTMIAQNLAHAAVIAGYSALFVSASDLLLDLSKQDTARGLERRFQHYARPSVLCIDEVGYLSYDNHAADLLFQIVNRRYERRPIVLTTNLSFKNWNTVFPNATCATALIDRLTHHAEILAIDGESYRKREAAEAHKARRRDNNAKS